MRYDSGMLLLCRLPLVLLAMMVLGTSAFAGSCSQGSVVNRQFIARGTSPLGWLREFSCAAKDQSKGHLAYPLAYVDPGSGQMIWQLLVAVCVGGLFYIKRVRNFLGKLVKKWFKKH